MGAENALRICGGRGNRTPKACARSGSSGVPSPIGWFLQYSANVIGEINPTTGKSPLHIDHVNGDWSDNRELNLQLLCPNCHALTPNYGVLNRGKGRPRYQKKSAEG